MQGTAGNRLCWLLMLLLAATYSSAATASRALLADANRDSLDLAGSDGASPFTALQGHLADGISLGASRRLLSSSDTVSTAAFVGSVLGAFFGGLLLGLAAMWVVMRQRQMELQAPRFPMWHGESCRTSRASGGRFSRSSFAVSRSIPVQLDPDLPMGLPVYDFTLPGTGKQDKLAVGASGPRGSFHGRISSATPVRVSIATPPMRSMDISEPRHSTVNANELTSSATTSPESSLNSSPEVARMLTSNNVVYEEHGWVVSRSPSLFTSPFRGPAGLTQTALIMPSIIRLGVGAPLPAGRGTAPTGRQSTGRSSGAARAPQLASQPEEGEGAAGTQLGSVSDTQDHESTAPAPATQETTLA